jgi:hypothetical protein
MSVEQGYRSPAGLHGRRIQRQETLSLSRVRVRRRQCHSFVRPCPLLSYLGIEYPPITTFLAFRSSSFASPVTASRSGKNRSPRKKSRKPKSKVVIERCFLLFSSSSLAHLWFCSSASDLSDTQVPRLSLQKASGSQKVSNVDVYVYPPCSGHISHD